MFWREMQPGVERTHISHLAAMRGPQEQNNTRADFVSVLFNLITAPQVVIPHGHYLSGSLSLRSDRWRAIMCYLDSSVNEEHFHTVTGVA